MAFRDQIFKLEILCFETQNFEFTNSKFRVCKLEILSLHTRNYSAVEEGGEFPPRPPYILEALLVPFSVEFILELTALAYVASLS